MPTDCLGELAALIIAHVSWRCANESLDRELLHVLRHINADQRALVVKQQLCQRLCQLGLTHAGWTQEEEAAQRLVWICKASARTTDCCSNCGNSVVLTNNAQVKLVLKVLKLVHLALHHLGHRNPGPRRNYLGNLVRGDLFLEDSAVFLLGEKSFFCLIVFTLKLWNSAVTKLGCLRQIALAGYALHLRLCVLNLGLQVLYQVNCPALSLPVSLHAIKLLLRRSNLCAEVLQALLRSSVFLLHQSLLLDLHLSELTINRINLCWHRIQFHAKP